MLSNMQQHVQLTVSAPLPRFSLVDCRSAVGLHPTAARHGTARHTEVSEAVTVWLQSPTETSQRQMCYCISEKRCQSV